MTAISGTINGSGFVNQPLTINRTGGLPSSGAAHADLPTAVPGNGRLIDAVRRRPPRAG